MRSGDRESKRGAKRGRRLRRYRVASADLIEIVTRRERAFAPAALGRPP